MGDYLGRPGDEDSGVAQGQAGRQGGEVGQEAGQQLGGRRGEFKREKFMARRGVLMFNVVLSVPSGRPARETNQYWDRA